MKRKENEIKRNKTKITKCNELLQKKGKLRNVTKCYEKKENAIK